MFSSSVQSIFSPSVPSGSSQCPPGPAGWPLVLTTARPCRERSPSTFGLEDHWLLPLFQFVSQFVSMFVLRSIHQRLQIPLYVFQVLVVDSRHPPRPRPIRERRRRHPGKWTIDGPHGQCPADQPGNCLLAVAAELKNYVGLPGCKIWANEKCPLGRSDRFSHSAAETTQHKARKKVKRYIFSKQRQHPAERGKKEKLIDR